MTLHSKKRHPILKIFFLFFLGCLFTAQAGNATPETDRNVVLAMGESRIYTDIPAARTAAVNQCLTFAVQNSAIGMIPFTGLAEKFDRIADLLSSEQNQFISDYKVLKEISTDKHYRVLVQVTVSTAKLKEALAGAGLVLGPANLPKILFLIAEKPAEAPSMDYWWKTEKSFFRADAAVSAMKTVLAAKDFVLIDTDMISPEMYADLGLKAELTDDQAIAIGRRVQADIVIVGDAVVQETSNRMGESLRTFQAVVNARGISVETGEPVASAMITQTSVSQDRDTGSHQSLSMAGEQAALSMAGQILSKWQELLDNKEQITIHIQGADILPYLVVFRNTLGKIDGVTRQQTLEMTPDAAVLQVRFDGGTSQDLADALLVKSFNTFGINIYDIDATKLSIELVPK